MIFFLNNKFILFKCRILIALNLQGSNVLWIQIPNFLDCTVVDYHIKIDETTTVLKKSITVHHVIIKSSAWRNLLLKNYHAY
jgi:hypothetical protein